MRSFPMNNLVRNYKILEERMIEQMRWSLEVGKSLIDSELDAGVLNFVVKPVVKSFYKYWSDKDASVGTLEQIRVTLDAAKELVLNGDASETRFNEVIDNNFSIYLANDQTDRQCKKTHPNYNKLKEITRQCFISQVEEAILYLKVDDDVKDYNELSRAVFKSKEIAFKALKRQLDFNDAGIATVEKDDTILKVLTGKNIILKVLRKGFESTKQKLIEDLDLIFN
jgi:hypothetical protein